METIFYYVLVIIVFVSIYIVLQIYRLYKYNELVDYWRWKTNGDKFRKYTFCNPWKMIKPRLKNWFGLKIPKDKDF